MKKEFYKLSSCENLIREVIAKGGTFRFYPRGTSMEPTIHEGADMVELAMLPSVIKKHQIVLYKRKNGSFVLHRVVKINKGSYTMRGDNQFVNEPGIKREQMIGVAISIIRGEKRTDTSDIWYRIRIWCWVKSAKIRLCYKKIRSEAGKAAKKFLKKIDFTERNKAVRI